MGYDLHITRSNEWPDAESAPITFDEWKAYIEQDSEMRMDGYAECKVEGEGVVRTESDGLAVWVGYSRHNVGGDLAWSTFAGGGS